MVRHCGADALIPLSPLLLSFFFVSIISNFKASWEEEDKKNSYKIIMDPWYVAGKWETKEGRPESPSLSWQVDAASLKVNQCLL